jgi:hypothetical protein
MPGRQDARPDAENTEVPIVKHGCFGQPSLAWGFACAVLLSSAVASRAQDTDKSALRELIEQNAKQIDELNRQVEAREAAPPAAQATPAGKLVIDDGSIKKIVADYLHENPGAGMPPSVQVGYGIGGPGFVIRSAPAAKYVPWDDESKIPFELDIRGRIQMAYYGYKVTDAVNHLTAQRVTPPVADFSQLEIKRAQLFFTGTAFDPDLRYHIRLHGDTRGLPAIPNNGVVQTAGSFAPNGNAVTPGAGLLVDHSMRLFECWVAYDIHPCCWSKGCGCDCGEDTPKYAPTLSLTAGKIKPFFGLEEFLGNQNEQFVEFSMADLMFDSDGDNRLMAAGATYKGMEDRLFAMAVVTNGAENLNSSNTLDNLPGFIAGVWYDIGGSWDYDLHRWNLFGDSISDIDYSCCPVARVGGSIDVVTLGRRSIYGDGESQRYFVTNPQPNGTRLINLLNGDGAAANAPNSPNGSHGVDAWDVYTYNAFMAAKYRGFSILNEWWFRSMNNFQTTRAGGNNIIYSVAGINSAPGVTANYLFPAGAALFDYGTNVQGGYFVIPKKLEVALRLSYINGDSGDAFGNGTFRTVAVPGVAGPVRLASGAFTHFHSSEEYSVAVNYFFRRQLVKWQTDLSYYTGGNPAAEGASIAGYRNGADGWLLRSQIQFFF